MWITQLQTIVHYLHIVYFNSLSSGVLYLFSFEMNMYIQYKYNKFIKCKMLRVCWRICIKGSTA